MQLTTNTTAFIESEVYSQFILKNLHDGLLGTQFYRDVGDFGKGTTLHIKTVGSVTIQEAAENVALDYNPIESGEITLQVTDYIGDAWYVTQDLRVDGSEVEQLMTERSVESTRAIQEHFETRFLATANAGQTDANANNINNHAHRIASSETNDIFSIKHLSAMKLAFNKANVPATGRVFICDGVVENTLNDLVSITVDVTDFAKNILQQGLADGMNFVMRLYGWDIITSNRLPTGSFGDGTDTVTTGVANICMCVLDDQTKPVMAAWRRQPKMMGEFNQKLDRDEFVVRAKFALGVQRLDTLGVIITDATNVA